jgi:hypothetical protein
MTTLLSEPEIGAAMDRLAGDSRHRTGRSVRGVARWAHNQGCPTNNAMFAARIDADHLLTDTELGMDFGLSPFALARGERVERIGRANAYAVTVDLLRRHFGFGIEEVVSLDLRHRFPKNNIGLMKRARLTREAIEAAIQGRRDAPNIIDGAVLTAQIGGYRAHLEADGVGAKMGPVFHINEFKAWPVIDGHAEDASKLGAAEIQMGLYRYLLGDLIEALGGSVETVSAMGLLVTPQNVGLTLVGSPIDLTRATRVAQTTLANLPDPAGFVGALPSNLDFAMVRDHSRTEEARIDTLHRIANTLGTRYQDTCFASCPLAKFCRLRAHRSAAPTLAGAAAARFLPGVISLRRAADLADGAPGRTTEVSTGVAPILATAGVLYRQKSSGAAPAPIAQVPRRASA